MTICEPTLSVKLGKGQGRAEKLANIAQAHTGLSQKCLELEYMSVMRSTRVCGAGTRLTFGSGIRQIQVNTWKKSKLAVLNKRNWKNDFDAKVGTKK
ncbi:hypothetical protein V1478_005973 [Vespula squamosa]|uniref:Uncharacterized protein n=1 Tax=Vespula squamosa TaxID=30214 RepID=A0ABD2B8X8_VESSQ